MADGRPATKQSACDVGLYLAMAGRYLLLMRLISLFLACLLPVPAIAMNWEGHDDWMLDFQPAYTLESLAPNARPLPPRDCPVKPEDVKKNPYEQIPLPRHKCPEKAEPKR
jgi:hypothetical protein